MIAHILNYASKNNACYCIQSVLSFLDMNTEIIDCLIAQGHLTQVEGDKLKQVVTVLPYQESDLLQIIAGLMIIRPPAP